MIDTSTFMWYTRDKTATVWAHAESGEVLIADCYNKNLTTSSQRLNARLIAEAPVMFALLQEASSTMDYDQFEVFAGILHRVSGKSDPQ